MSTDTNRLRAIKPREPGQTPKTHRAHTVRTASGGTVALVYGARLAIKLHCTECMGFEGNPRDCTSPLCALYPFRGLTRRANG